MNTPAYFFRRWRDTNRMHRKGPLFGLWQYAGDEWLGRRGMKLFYLLTCAVRGHEDDSYGSCIWCGSGTKKKR